MVNQSSPKTKLRMHEDLLKDTQAFKREKLYHAILKLGLSTVSMDRLKDKKFVERESLPSSKLLRDLEQLEADKPLIKIKT